MTPFDEINVPTPRCEEICQRFARRMDPWWGFVIAGLLYAVIAMIVIGLAILKLSDWLGFADESRGAQVIAFTGILVGGAASWRLFKRWRQRRIADKLDLVRHGRLQEVLVNKQGLHWHGSRRFSNVVRVTDAGLTLECGFGPLLSCRQGERIWLLHNPAIVAIVAFDRWGAMHNGLVLRS